jgi:hypothetical protein
LLKEALSLQEETFFSQEIRMGNSNKKLFFLYINIIRGILFCIMNWKVVDDGKLHLGKDGAIWAHVKGVDPPTLGSMGALERLDDLIDTRTKSHVGQFKQMHRARVHQRGHGAPIQKDVKVHEHTGSMSMFVRLGMLLRKGA